MKDLENLTTKVAKDIDHFQNRHHLNQREMTDILLSLGVDSFLKDMSTRKLNGNKMPYLAHWHLRQGQKYYQKDLESEE